jgi:hypothetical protein
MKKPDIPLIDRRRAPEDDVKVRHVESGGAARAHAGPGSVRPRY